MSTSTTPITSDPGQEMDDRVAHVVGPIYTEQGKVQGRTRVIEAMVAGEPVEAICGHLFVPSRNPDVLPVCGACKAIVERRG